MSRTIACPDESDLLALAAGEVAPPALLSHVDACRPCLRKLRRLKAEIVHLRSSVGPQICAHVAAVPGPQPEPRRKACSGLSRITIDALDISS